MVLSKLWPLFLTIGVSTLTQASTASQTLRVTAAPPIVTQEQQLRKQPVRSSEFADIPHTTARSRCEATQPPEALTTPNPVLETSDPAVKIKVSFIVGTDGRVHSPLRDRSQDRVFEPLV